MPLKDSLYMPFTKFIAFPSETFCKAVCAWTTGVTVRHFGVALVCIEQLLCFEVLYL